MAEPVRVAIWSGPRNISTAMMRAWENRPDCAVVDEPLYAAYLADTGIDHPARDEVIAAGETDWRKVVSMLRGPVPGAAPVFYAKQMTHHLLPQMERDWIPEFRNILLIRDPREVVASYVRSRESVEPADIGIHQQVELYELLSEDGPPPVVDSGDFLRDPRGYLTWICDWLGIEFTEAMLAWPAGPRDSDGIWAPHWYHAVRASTGFEPWRPREIDLSQHDEDVAQDCADDYAMLHVHRLTLPELSEPPGAIAP